MPDRPRIYRPTPREARTPETRPTAHQRGYTAAWQRASRAYLDEHPLCVRCERRGRVTEATVVDHVTPHRGDPELFWDADGNWQSLCAACHNRKTATEDRRR